MATATAITDKRARASQLRSETTTLNDELTQASRKLDTARRALGALESKRVKFTEAAAAGNPPKPADVAALNTEISTAQISVDGLAAAVSGKQTALDAIRAQLETLGREIALEDQQEARRARFDALTKQATEAADRISEKLRSLIEEDLVAFDHARDLLVTEFIGGQYSTATGPEVTDARAVINKLKGQFFNGPFLAVTRRLLRAGWTERGDLAFEIKNLRLPR